MSRLPSVFACLTVQITVLQRSKGALKQVLQHKTQLCVLALAEFKNSWPFAGWMYQLFQNLLARLRAGDDESSNHNSEVNYDESLMSQVKPTGFSSNERLPSLEADDRMVLERSASGSSGGFATTPANDVQAPIDMFPLDDSFQTFNSLENVDWLGQSMDFIANMPPDSWAWNDPPIPLSDMNAMVV